MWPGQHVASFDGSQSSNPNFQIGIQLLPQQQKQQQFVFCCVAAASPAWCPQSPLLSGMQSPVLQPLPPALEPMSIPLPEPLAFRRPTTNLETEVMKLGASAAELHAEADRLQAEAAALTQAAGRNMRNSAPLAASRQPLSCLEHFESGL